MVVVRASDGSRNESRLRAGYDPRSDQGTVVPAHPRAVPREQIFAVCLDRRYPRMVHGGSRRRSDVVARAPVPTPYRSVVDTATR